MIIIEVLESRKDDDKVYSLGIHINKLIFKKLVSTVLNVIYIFLSHEYYYLIFTYK